MFRLESPLSIEEEKIVADTIKCGIEVHRNLGPGFRERIYKDALCLELDAQGLPFECEKEIQVTYKQWKIPGQRVDLIVAGIPDLILASLVSFALLRDKPYVREVNAVGKRISARL